MAIVVSVKSGWLKLEQVWHFLWEAAAKPDLNLYEGSTQPIQKSTHVGCQCARRTGTARVGPDPRKGNIQATVQGRPVILKTLRPSPMKEINQTPSSSYAPPPTPRPCKKVLVHLVPIQIPLRHALLAWPCKYQEKLFRVSTERSCKPGISKLLVSPL